MQMHCLLESVKFRMFLQFCSRCKAGLVESNLFEFLFEHLNKKHRWRRMLIRRGEEKGLRVMRCMFWGVTVKLQADVMSPRLYLQL